MGNTSICDLFLENYEALKEYSFKICKRMEVAEDITQEVFLSIYTKYVDNDGQIKNKLLFLYRTIRFNTYSEMNKNNETRALNENEVSVDPLRNDFLFEDLMLKALDDIPSQRRKVFHLRRRRHLKVKEIAEIMNIKPKTIENHITPVMNFLKERLLSTA